MRIARLQWNEHENGTDKNSECAKHLMRMIIVNLNDLFK